MRRISPRDYLPFILAIPLGGGKSGGWDSFRLTEWRYCLFILLCLSTVLLGQGIKRPQSPPGVVPTVEPTYPGLQQFYVDSTLFKSTFSKFSRKYEIDSTKQYIYISEKLFDFNYRLPVGMGMDYYVQKRIEHDNREKWREAVLRHLKSQQAAGGGGIELNIPVRIKNKTFRRIFGGDRVGLRVTGNISFELAGRSEDRSGSAVSSYEERGNFSPKFKQTQQFRVEGRVGDKVSVSVDQNSEATFDFENTLKLIYDGDEDEIVQKIEAGNVALSLPSTNYVSTSANHQGLFGIKTQMKVGNLSFTGIASLERGENQKISKTGSASENTFRIKDIDYTPNKFFFIDSSFVENFENFDDQMRWQQTPNLSRITVLDVWKSTTQTNEESKFGWAVTNPKSYSSADSLPSVEIPGKKEKSFFVKLEYGREYDYDEFRGYFWINENVTDQDIIAIAYATESGDTVGQIYTGDSTQTDTFVFKLIKPRAAKPGYKSTWKLAMRNVYNLGSSGISTDGFDARILYSVTGEDQEVEVQSGRTFNYLMGLDRLNEQGAPVAGGDKKIDRLNGWIFNLSNGYLIFPSLTPFAPEDSTYYDRPSPSNFDISHENYVDIYNIKDRTLAQQRSKFDIEITSTSVSSTFELGFNVLEQSEVVRLNGRPLTRDKDYTIDYFSGTLQVIAEEARRADAVIEIEYERASLFQLDKKTLLGGRLEYEFGDDNFIGFTALYFNQTTLDQRIRVGQEPIRNLVWDVNSSLTFRPNFLSSMFDALPIVETSAESKLKIEAEYAEVNPDPNTFEEPNLHEKGVAYIDDFEGSKRATSLGILYRTYSFASIPRRFKVEQRDSVDYQIPVNNENLMFQMDQNRLKMNWYNPFNQVPIQDIWPERDVNTQTGTTTNVLNLRWRNDNISPDSAWAGIMRSTVSFPDQKKTKFIEIWLKPRLESTSENTQAQINIDIGRINEDYWIRGLNQDGVRSLGNLNTEDANLNGLLDEGEDVGIDGIPDGAPGDDPDDLWRAPRETTPEFLYINGTEGNGEQKTARYPDTEDLAGDGLNTFDDYFEYSFDLADEDNPYIQGRTRRDDGTLTGWRLYRIPIRNYLDEDVIGSPDSSFQEIFFVRIWVNNIPQESDYRGIQIATFDFVGSDWEEQGILQKNDAGFFLDDSLFSVTVYNDEENTVSTAEQEGYQSPPGVSGVEDRITKAVSKEQSLVLQLHELYGDSTIAEAKKQLGEKMNLVHYRTIKMFVHGDRDLPPQDSPLEFYIRFGSTIDNYYEYGEKVYPHWDSRNELVLDFDELTQTRQDMYLADTTGRVFFRRDPNNPEKYFRVVGKPGLHNINYFVFGVRNTSQNTLRDMDVWLDELRVTDIEKEKGAAMRLYTDLTVADIGRLTAQWELIDDNFRRIEQQFPSVDGRDKTREKQSYVASVSLDKFLPEFLGLSLPIDARYTKTRNVPKYFYNTDQRTHYEFSNFSDRLEAFFGLNKLPQDLDITSDHSETRAIGGTFRRKNRPRDPWYLKYSINQIEVDADYSDKHSRNPTTLFNDTKTISGRFKYSLSFGNDNYIRPLGWMGKSRLLKPLTSQKLYYTPSNSNFSVSMSDNETESQNRIEIEPTQTISVLTNRQFGVNYKLTDNIDLALNRSYKSDAFAKGYRAQDVIEKIFSEFDFGEDNNVSQHFSIDYRPKFFDWMNQSYRYASDFTFNLTNPTTTRLKSAASKIDRQLRFDLKPSMLANKIYNPKKKRLPGAPQEKPKNEDDEGENSGKAKNDSTGEKQKSKLPNISIPNPAVWIYKFFNAWKSIDLDLNFQDSYNHYNLADFPKWDYQFGFASDPGVDTTLAGNIQAVLPGIQKTRGISSGMQFDIIKNLSSNFRYRHDKSTTQNNQRNSESINSSYFFTGQDPEENKKSWWSYVPDWSLRLSGVEQFLFFGSFAQSMSLEHSRSGKFSESARIDGDTKIRDQWSYSNGYQPLLGINFTTRFGLTGSFRINNSINYNYNPTGAVTRSEQSGINITASYSVTQGFRIPLPFIKMKKLNNEIQFSLAFDKSGNQSYSKSAGNDEFVEREVNKNWKIRPSATYRFSQNVNGTAFFEKGQTENKRTGVYSYFEFGINVNISIR